MRVLRLRHRVPEEGADAEDIQPGLPKLFDGLDAGRLPLHGEEGREVAAVAGGEDDAVHPQEHDEGLGAGVAREERLGNPEVDAQDVHAGEGDRALAQRVTPAEGGVLKAFRIVLLAMRQLLLALPMLQLLTEFWLITSEAFAPSRDSHLVSVIFFTKSLDVNL